MAPPVYDTQQGATLTIATDAITLRLTNIGAIRAILEDIRTTYLATTGKHTFTPGELKNYPRIPITYQNSPGLANPTIGLVQTFTIVCPTGTGATVPESITFTGYVGEGDELPGFSSESEGLQMKSFSIKPDGLTGPTRTVST